MSEPEEAPEGADTSKPSAARLYDYFLGGTANYEVDRVAAEKLRARVPELADIAWANRGFLQRATRWLAEEAGVRQFIDVGAGLPTQNNTHDAARRVDPAARVVYVDHDPLVLVHARRLLEGVGGVAFIRGDLRDPDGVLGHPVTRALIDFDEPVGLLVVAVAHFVSDRDRPWAVVADYMDRLASGSFLALSHGTADRQPAGRVQAWRDLYAGATEEGFFRSREQVERFFAGLELVPPYPGAAPVVCYVGEWGAEDPAAADSDGSRWVYAGVARKP